MSHHAPEGEPDRAKDFFDMIAEGQAYGPSDLEKFKEHYFPFGEYELKKYHEFVKEQIATGKVRYGTCGMNFSISFMPTGVGPEIWAKCYDTGADQSLINLDHL